MIPRLSRLLFLICLGIIASCGKLNTINVYFAGGQSNAQESWANAIETEILKIDPTAIVIYNNHGGKSIKYWYDEGEIQENLIDDVSFISPFTDYRYNFAGLFWFQGESDCLVPELYEERFNGFYNNLREMIGDYNFPVFFHTVYMTDPAFPPDDIRAVQKSIIASRSNFYEIDSISYNRFDGIHLYPNEAVRIAKDVISIYSYLF